MESIQRVALATCLSMIRKQDFRTSYNLFAEKQRLFNPDRPLRSSKFGIAGFDFELTVYHSRVSNSNQCVFSIRRCSHPCYATVVQASCDIYVLASGNPDNDANRLLVARTNVDIYSQLRELGSIDLNKINQTPYFTVYAEIEFCPEECAVSEYEPIFNKINGEGKSVAQSNLQMLDSADFTDCVFKIGDDEIKAHRCFLAQHSNVFRTMFSQDSMAEAQKGIVEIKDSDYLSVRAMLEYMYCGSTTVNENNVEGVLALAEKYAVIPLKELCVNYLASKINTANIGQTVAIGEMYSLAPLIKRCARYLAENSTSVLRSKEWEQLKKQNPELAIRLFELSF